jgi:hypothetical protein
MLSTSHRPREELVVLNLPPADNTHVDVVVDTATLAKMNEFGVWCMRHVAKRECGVSRVAVYGVGGGGLLPVGLFDRGG